MLCNKCGNRVEDSAKICNKCGNILILSNQISNNNQQNNIQVKIKSNRNKIIICIFVILLLTLSGAYYTYVKVLEHNEKERVARINETIKNIKSHYDDSVVVVKDTDLIDDNGNVVGTVYKDAIINLNDIDIDENTKYFNIENLNYNLNYKSVMVNHDTPRIINKLSKENRYKNYIPYNKNLVTKDSYSLYYEGNKVYTFNKSDIYPIIINNYEDYYYVEFDNKLYSIHKDDIKEIVNANNSTKKNKNYITTLCYHKVNKEGICSSQYTCIKKEDFDTQMKYLKDNNYFTLTMEEMYMYISGNVQIEKGVLVTLDDGWQLSGAIEVFDKYDLNGVSFVYTNLIENILSDLGDTYNSSNIEFQSHTHDLHRNKVCSESLSKIGSSSQGGAILCESEEYIVNDLEKSINIINGLGKNKVIALAYPFYDFNDRAINLIKKAGLKLAFTGHYNKKGRAVVGNNPYMIPRMPIREYTSFSTWKSYL